MKITLRHLPETALTEEYCSITRVVHDMKSCTVYLMTSPSHQQIEIEFGGVVGVKILDERDFGQFWRSNMETFEEIPHALVSQIVRGGWVQSDEIQGSHVPSGFYGEVLEYFVSGDYECVNVLCAAPPILRLDGALT